MTWRGENGKLNPPCFPFFKRKMKNVFVIHPLGEIIISNDKYRMEEIDVNTYTYVAV